MIALLLACVSPSGELPPPPPVQAPEVRLGPTQDATALEYGALARTPAGERLLFADIDPAPGPRTRLYALARHGDRLVAEPWLTHNQPVLSMGAGDVDDDGIDEIALISPTQVRVLDGVTLRERLVFDWDSEWPGQALVLDVDDDDLPEVLLPGSNGEIGKLVGADGLPATVPWADIDTIFGLVQVDSEPGLELLTSGGVYDPATLELLWPTPGVIVGPYDVDRDGRVEVVARGDRWVALFDPHSGEAWWTVSLPTRVLDWAAIVPGGDEVVVRSGTEQLRLDIATGEVREVAVHGDLSLGSAPLAVAPDLDGDGLGDLIRTGVEVQQWDPRTGDVLAREVGVAWTPTAGAVLDVDNDGELEVVAVGASASLVALAWFDPGGALEGLTWASQTTAERVVAAQRAWPLLAVGGDRWQVLEVRGDGQPYQLTSAPIVARDVHAADPNGNGEEQLTFVSVQGVLSAWSNRYRVIGQLTPAPDFTLAGDLDGDRTDELVGVSADQLCAWRLTDATAIDCLSLSPGTWHIALVDEGSWQRVALLDGAGTVVGEARLRQGAWRAALPIRMIGRRPGPLLTAGGWIWSPQRDLLSGRRIGRAPRLLETRGLARTVDAEGRVSVVGDEEGVAWWGR